MTVVTGKVLNLNILEYLWLAKITKSVKLHY